MLFGETLLVCNASDNYQDSLLTRYSRQHLCHILFTLVAYTY